MRHALTAIVLVSAAMAVGAVPRATPAATAPQLVSNCPDTASPVLVPFASSVGGILVDPNCQYIYLTNTTLNRVEIFSLTTLSFETPIQVGAQPMGLDVTPDGTLLYVANSGGNNISVIDLAQRVESKRITVPAPEPYLPWSIAIMNNGKALFTLSDSSFGGLRELTLATDAIITRTDLPFSTITSKAVIRASHDRSTAGVTSGSSAGSLVMYFALTDSFGLVKRLDQAFYDVSLDATGSTFLVTPGSMVVDSTPSMTGTILGGGGGGFGAAGNESDPTRGIGYRSTQSRLDVLNLSTFLKVGELPLGDSVSNSSNSNRIGRMDLSPAGALIAVVTNTGFSIVRPLEEAPQNLNLVRNGRFASGVTNWATFATPDSTYMQSGVTAGVFRFNRLPPPPGTTNQAVVFQETGMALPAGAPIQARFDLGNSGADRRRISVLLIESDFSDLHVCTFWLPGNSPLATYRMRSHTTKPWTNAAIYFYAATASLDGGFNLLDDVSLQYDATLEDDVTECVDPRAPVSPGGPDGPDMLVNGDFATDPPTPWATFGTITSQIAGGVFEFIRPTSTPPAGVVLQQTGQALPANTILTATFDLGNSSAVRKRVTVLLHDNNFNDLSACTFWLPSGQALSAYTMRTFATQAWSNATISVYAATVGPHQWIQLDNVTYRTTPSAAIAGTDCIEPASSSPSPGAARTTGGAPAVAPRALGRLPDRSPNGVHVGGISESIDLAGASQARLTLAVRLLSEETAGEIQISVDGQAWRPLLTVAASEDWAAIELDLSPWLGRTIALRFVTPEIRARPVWMIRGFRVEIQRER
jgi:YVTN family beta-propeller protein